MRTERLIVRLSPEELSKLRDLAHQAGISVSTLVRAVVLHSPD